MFLEGKKPMDEREETTGARAIKAPLDSCIPSYLSQQSYEVKHRTLHQLIIIVSIPHICHFFTQAKILDRKIYTEERVNYGKRISRQNSVNCDLLAQATYTNYTLSVKLHTVCKTTY